MYKHKYIQCICMSMCSIPACLYATLKSPFNSVDDPLLPPPLLPPMQWWEVRAPLLVPLLIISFNLRKQEWAAMSIPRLKAATGTHTPFGLLPLSIQGGIEGDWVADKKRRKGRERRSIRWRGRCKSRGESRESRDWHMGNGYKNEKNTDI